MNLPEEPRNEELLIVSRRASQIRAVATVVGLSMVAAVALIAFGRSDGDSAEASRAVGKIVPELQGTTLAGEPFDIDALRGRWVVVNLFATWCVPCQVEHPELVAFDEEHRRLGDVSLVSVVFGDEDDDVRAFFAERGGSWPVMGQDYSSVIIDFGATGVPETFLVAPNGIVVERILGGVTRDGLNRLIDGYRN